VSEPIQHHYVPAVYLRRFSDTKGNLCVYDKEQKRAFLSAPSAVAKCRDFNTLTDRSGNRDRTTVESFFGQSESMWPKLLEGIEKGTLDFSQQIQVIQFAALQAMRSVMTRDILLLFAGAIIPKDDRTRRALGIDENEIRLLNKALTGDRASENEVSLRLSGHFHKKITQIAESMNFWLVRLDSNQGLFTSDNPALFLSFKKIQSGEWTVDFNLPTSRTILAYPLSPNMLLFGDNLNRVNGMLFNMYFGMIRKPEAVTRTANQLLFLCARRQVYSSQNDLMTGQISADVCSSVENARSEIQIGTLCRKLSRMIHSQFTL
jgi:Protein of unknown function (DUF4238)